MAIKNYKAFIVEGAARERQIIENLKEIYFEDQPFKIITMPAEQNIYMLWNRMKEDEFQTDIIEVLRESNKEIAKTLDGIEREDISEVYLFFDYDGQQDNLKTDDVEDVADVISQMLKNFDNETENGKLYISYPMVEALKDYMPDVCGDGRNCFWEENEFDSDYKRIAADRSAKRGFNNFTFQDWKDAISVFIMRVSCLMGERKDIIEYREYNGTVSPILIFELQKRNIQSGKLLILSAFPEFLLDYYRDDFWKKCVKYKKLQKENPGCQGKHFMR